MKKWKWRLDKLVRQDTNGFHLLSNPNQTLLPNHNQTLLPNHNQTLLPNHSQSFLPNHNRTLLPNHNQTLKPNHNQTLLLNQNQTLLPNHIQILLPKHNQTFLPNHNQTLLSNHHQTLLSSHNKKPWHRLRKFVKTFCENLEKSEKNNFTLVDSLCFIASGTDKYPLGHPPNLSGRQNVRITNHCVRIPRHGLSL